MEQYRASHFIDLSRITTGRKLYRRKNEASCLSPLHIKFTLEKRIGCVSRAVLYLCALAVGRGGRSEGEQ